MAVGCACRRVMTTSREQRLKYYYSSGRFRVSPLSGGRVSIPVKLRIEMDEIFSGLYSSRMISAAGEQR